MNPSPPFRTTLKVVDSALLPVLNILVNIFADILYIWGPFPPPRDQRTCYSALSNMLWLSTAPILLIFGKLHWNNQLTQVTPLNFTFTAVARQWTPLLLHSTIYGHLPTSLETRHTGTLYDFITACGPVPFLVLGTGMLLETDLTLDGEGAGQ